MAIKPRFLASMGYHIFFTIMLRSSANNNNYVLQERMKIDIQGLHESLLTGSCPLMDIQVTFITL